MIEPTTIHVTEKSCMLAIAPEKNLLSFIEEMTCEAFEVVSCTTTNGIVDKIGKVKPSVLIVSNSVSKDLGLDLLSKIHSKFNSLPIILLINKQDSTSMYEPLNIGLLECMYYPPENEELVSTARALIAKSVSDVTWYQDVIVDITKSEVYRQNKKIPLGPIEKAILMILISNPLSTFSRSKIIDRVWNNGKRPVDDRTVDVHINRLRSAINVIGRSLIKTIRSQGYCLDLPEN